MRNRRSAKLSALLLLLTFLPAFRGQAQIQTNVPALKDVYAKDFTIGCLLSYAHVGFPTDPVVPGQSSVVDPNGGYLIKYHMNSMSPGNNMKPVYTVNMTASAAAYSAATTQAAKDSIDVNPIISFNGNIIAQLNWAKRQGFTFRGHTLVWHSQTPGVAFFCTGYNANNARLSKERMTQRLENYIREMIRQLHEGWPGLLSAYDVVNEAINDSGIDRMQDSDWYLTFGDNSYIIKAFEFARKYTKLYNETQIKLYYNDYNTTTAAKADGIVRLLTPIFQAGTLDGIGMQEHDANGSPTAAAFIATYNKFAPICTEMAVTELDVTTGSAAPTAGQLQTQANQYGLLFKCFVERSYKSGRGKIINVSKDGLNDTYTFKTNQSSSLWDGSNQCKPAFYQVANVGLYYNALDSMITAARLVQQGAYTNASWSAFQSTLTAAVTARDQNYTVNQAVDAALNTAKNNLSSAVSGLTTIVSGAGSHESDVPAMFALFQNYPNPFNPTTAISFQLSATSVVKLEVVDALGRVVATIVDGEQSAGSHVVTWSAHNLPSGIYVCRIVAGHFAASRKMLLAK
ncbi:MAG: endo-1,4-beta-xylanase [Ignavibacteriales bacterium]|nr:endo-1,4-beta-xylanase [Ignavibacteriales bacterium]